MINVIVRIGASIQRMGVMLGIIIMATVSVAPSDWVTAQELCGTNEGVAQYDANVLGNPIVSCVNGAKFTLGEVK